MERYIVKPEDLIGEIEGFPIEVVQKMVDYQVEQGNKADVSIFQRFASAAQPDGGFNWPDTEEYMDWMDIIFYREFDLFFEHNSKSKN